MGKGFDLTGRVVWVTGSSRGIGRGVAEQLGRAGARIVVHARTLEALTEVTEELEAIGAAPGPLADLEVKRFRRQLDLNLTSAFATVRAAYPLLREAGGAAVLVSATATTSATPMFGAYGAAKAGVEHLSRSLAAEWGPEVRVNCISPGLIRTEGSMQAVFRGSEELAERAGRTTAVGRIGETSDIAYACQYLLSDAAAYVSGAVIVVDGGPTEGPTQRILRAIAD